MKHEGVAAVRVQYMGVRRSMGDDTPYLMASFRRGGSDAPAGGVIASGVMLAMNGGAAAVLPGVKSTAAGLVPPGAVGAGNALRAASIGTSDVPLGFSLPSIGPILPERPSFGLPVAAAGESDDLRNVGLAYWGGRVTGV
jgi:rare lipoprotein A